MGLFDLTDLAIARGLDGAGLRQQALTNNLANANTPDFKRSDVNFQSSLAAALSSADPTAAVRGLTFQAVTDGGGTMTADGNNVDVDAELADLTQNSLAYESMLSIEKTRMGMLQNAIGGSAA